MKYTKFEIKNFKGIQDAVIDLARSPNTNIISFVGLNESGKTTILEAINSFSTDEGYTQLSKDSFKLFDVNDLIPKDKTASFTGSRSQ